MPDYKKGKIYKIVCNITSKIYIGSTTQTLSVRLAEHRRKYKLFKEGKTNNVTSYQIIEQGEFDIVLIENCFCESKEELHRRERFFIESLECVNKNVPTRTKHEYYKENKDDIKEKIKDYYETNKAHILEIKKQYHLKNKKDVNEKHRQYHQANRETILERQRQRKLKLKTENEILP